MSQSSLIGLPSGGVGEDPQSKENKISMFRKQRNKDYFFFSYTLAD